MMMSEQIDEYFGIEGKILKKGYEGELVRFCDLEFLLQL